MNDNRRNPLERRNNLEAVLASPELVVPDLLYDYSQIGEDSRSAVRSAAVDIKERTGRIKTHLDRARDGMLQVGATLISVKAMLPHGQFADWCQIELDMSQRTVQRMMQASAEFGDKSDTVAHLSDSILYLLSGPTVPVQAKTEIIEHAKPVTKAQAVATIKKHQPAQPVSLVRTLTLDETLAVVWRVVKYNRPHHPDSEPLAKWTIYQRFIIEHDSPSQYRQALTPGVQLDEAILDQARMAVIQELEGNMTYYRSKHQASQDAPVVEKPADVPVVPVAPQGVAAGVAQGGLAASMVVAGWEMQRGNVTGQWWAHNKRHGISTGAYDAAEAAISAAYDRQMTIARSGPPDRAAEIDALIARYQEIDAMDTAYFRLTEEAVVGPGMLRRLAVERIERLRMLRGGQ